MKFLPESLKTDKGPFLYGAFTIIFAYFVFAEHIVWDTAAFWVRLLTLLVISLFAFVLYLGELKELTKAEFTKALYGLPVIVISQALALWAPSWQFLFILFTFACIYAVVRFLVFGSRRIKSKPLLMQALYFVVLLPVTIWIGYYAKFAIQDLLAGEKVYNGSCQVKYTEIRRYSSANYWYKLIITEGESEKELRISKLHYENLGGDHIEEYETCPNNVNVRYLGNTKLVLEINKD